MIEELLTTNDLHGKVGEALADCPPADKPVLSAMLAGMVGEWRRSGTPTPKTLYTLAQSADVNTLRRYLQRAGQADARTDDALTHARNQLADLLRPRMGRPPATKKPRSEQLADAQAARRGALRKEGLKSILIWAKPEIVDAFNSIQTAHGLSNQQQTFELIISTLQEKGILVKK